MNRGAKLTSQRPRSGSLNLRKNYITADKKSKNFFWKFFLGFAEVYSSGRVDWAIVCEIMQGGSLGKKIALKKNSSFQKRHKPWVTRVFPMACFSRFFIFLIFGRPLCQVCCWRCSCPLSSHLFRPGAFLQRLGLPRDLV